MTLPIARNPVPQSPGNGRGEGIVRREKGYPIRKPRTLAARVELIGGPLRAAVRELAFEGEDRAAAAWTTVFSPRINLSLAVYTPERAARLLALVWMTATRFGGDDQALSFRDAEAWFRGGVVPVPEPWLADAISPRQDTALLLLRSMQLDEQTVELLPYILEPYQRGSRLSVRRDETHVADRLEKKAGGVFYTPGDVAEHMCKVALAGTKAKRPLCLDPAGGTGVFLRCLLRRIVNTSSPASRLDVITGQLFAFDISAVALDAAAFVLLWDCLMFEPSKVPNPWAAWHRIRMNLLETDALTVRPTGRADGGRRSAAATRQRVAGALQEVRFIPAERVTLQTVDLASSLFDGGGGHRLDHLLPEAAGGLDVYVGNPPYSPVGGRDDLAALSRAFRCAAEKPVTATENIYPFFVEQMWRLTGPKRAGALVLPLSIAFHRGERLRAVRRDMAGQDVTWRCEFYDREPHALFGEDVKTRNAIISMLPGGRQLYTGRLVRWTSRTRASLFENPRHVRLDGPYEDGIPKLADHDELDAYNRLRSTAGFGRLAVRCGSASPDDATSSRCTRSLYLASTAYNFLNVFPYLPTLAGQRLSENPVHHVVCASDEALWAIYACLSSQVAFWMWYVRGDGFHVPRWFIDEFPTAGSLDPSTVTALSLVGQALWSEVRQSPIVSNNKGRHTLAFPQLAHGQLRTQADRLLLQAAGVPAGFADHLTSFLRDLVVIDPDDAGRAKRANAFGTGAVTHG